MRYVMRIRRALSVILLMGCSTLGWAQNGELQQDSPIELSGLSLEELLELRIDSVYGASRHNQKVTEAPSSVTIVTADDIQKYGYRTLADILRSVRGSYVTNDRNYSFLGVRGFNRPGDYNARILLLVDGHRLNDNIFGGALIGTEFPLDVDLIERLEIIRGPSSSLYGSSAFFGVINVITKDLKGVQAAGSVGSLRTGEGRLSYGQTFGSGLEVMLSGSAYDSRGHKRLYFKEFDAPGTNNGIAENVDSDEFKKFFGKLKFANFTLQGMYGARDKDIPTASFGTVFNDPRSRTLEKVGYVDLQYRRELGSTWDLSSRVYFDRYGYDGDYIYDLSEDENPFLVVYKDFARGGWWGSELRLTKRAEKHTVTVGSEYRDDFRQDQFNYDEDPFFSYLDDKRDRRNWAFDIQDEFRLHDKLTFNLGVRYDHYDSFGGTTNPRVGLIYNPYKATTLKILYGQAFRAPNAYELYWTQSDIAKANPTLRPETNKTSEVVLEHYLNDGTRLSATGFYYRIKDLITQQTDPLDELLVYNNVESINAKGFELEVEREWSTGLLGRFSYTFSDIRNELTGSGLTNSPKHLAHFNLIMPVANESMFAGIEVRTMSKRRTIAGNFTNSVLVPNVTISTSKLPKRLELSAGVYNLFGKKYGDPGSEEHPPDVIAQDGRSFRVKLTWTFPIEN